MSKKRDRVPTVIQGAFFPCHRATSTFFSFVSHFGRAKRLNDQKQEPLRTEGGLKLLVSICPC